MTTKLEELKAALETAYETTCEASEERHDAAMMAHKDAAAYDARDASWDAGDAHEASEERHDAAMMAHKAAAYDTAYDAYLTELKKAHKENSDG
jgi:hypothetical protein